MNMEQWAKDYLEAWHRHEVESILSFHSEDTVFASAAFGRNAIGKPAVRAALTAVFTVWPDLHFHVHRRYLRPGLAVFENTAEATPAIPFNLAGRLIQPDGRKVSFAVCDIFVIENGLIKRKDTYADALGYLTAMTAPAADAAVA